MSAPVNTGTNGNDTILAVAGNDTMNALGGTDTLVMTNAGAAGSAVDLASEVAFSSATGIDQIINFENVQGSAGADVLSGNSSDNVFFATAGVDVINGRGGVDTFDAASTNTAITANLTTSSVTGGFTATLSNIENITTGGGDDVVTDSSGVNSIATGGGADRVILSEGGSDSVDGGDGTDTVVFDGARGDYVVTWDGTTATVSIGSDTVTITNAGELEFSDKSVFLVDDDSDDYATIQSAVNAASNGDEILVAAGTYTEQVVVNGINDLLIKSTGAVTIQAPADVTQVATSTSGRALNGVVTAINSLNFVLEGVTVDGAGAGNSVDGPNANFIGVVFRNSSGGLTDVDITGIRDAYPGVTTTVDGFPLQSGNQRGVGLQVDNNSLMDFFMHGGTIDDFQKNATVFNRANLDVSGVTIIGGGAQTVNAQNGFQVLNSTGTLSDNVLSAIGYAGGADATSGMFLLFGNTDLHVTDNTITGTNGATTDAKVVGIFVLDFGTPNSGGSITGNVISFVDGGIDVSGGLGPNSILIENNTVNDLDDTDPLAVGVSFNPDTSATAHDVDGSDQADLLNGSEGGDTLDGLGGDDSLDGSGGDDNLAGGTGNDSITGGHGNDTITGGDGADSLDGGDAEDLITADGADTVEGGAGDDVMVLDVGTDPADVVVAQANFTGLELIHDGAAAGSRTYIVLDGMSIQAAIDAAADGDTILVAPGDYTTSANYNPTNNTNDPMFTNPVGLLVNKSVTIAGVDATGALITDADDVVGNVTASVESNWGTSFFVTAADVTITGLNFIAHAPGGTVNKAFEIIQDNFTLAYSVVGSAGGDIGATIYINDEVASALPTFVSAIQTFNIHNNVLKGDFVLANGAGFGHAITDLRLEANEFILNSGATLDWNWGVIITGRDDTVEWRIQSVGTLIATGNSFAEDYTTDRLLFIRDDDAARLPSAAFVEAFLADNGITNYSYAVDAGGVPSAVTITTYGNVTSGTTNAFVLALTAGNGSAWANAGDTLIVKTDGTPASETIVTDELSIDLRSSGLTFEMDGGVAMLTLLGSEDANVEGSADDNTITGNDGDNNITGGTGADTIDAAGGNDMLTGGDGSDDLDGGADDDTFVYSDETELTATEMVEGGTGTDTVIYADDDADTLTLTANVTGIEVASLSTEGLFDTVAMNLDASAVGNGLTINGNAAGNMITGTAFADTINSDDGNDTIDAGGGSDSVDGGAGMDEVTFAGARGDYTVTWDGTSAIVSDRTGTVTIQNAGKLQFSDKAVLLVDGSSDEYSTIQLAVNAASSGDEILVASGNYVGANITDKAISIIGSEAGVTVNGSFTVSDDMAMGEEMRFANMSINAAGQVQGISVRNSSADIVGVNGGSIVLDGVTIYDAREHGFFYAHPSNGSNPVNGNTVGTISILNSVFIRNGEVFTGARGQGHVNLFGFNGNLTVSDSNFFTTSADLGDAVFRGGTVGISGAPVNADKAISVTGIRVGTPGVGGYVDAGNLVMTNLNILGNYSTDVISLYTIQSFADVDISGLNIVARALWALFNVDSVSGPIDLSSAFVFAINQAPVEYAELQGLSTNDALTGTASKDLLYGRGGADYLVGGDGDDTFFYTAASEFAAGEVVSGGNGTDTVYFAAATASTLTLTSAVTGIENVFLNTNGTGNTIAMNINAAAVGNGLTINGNDAANILTGTAFGDGMEGMGGNDNLNGGGGADFLYGGAGTDTLVGGASGDYLEGGVDGDVLNGGSGSDTAQYARSAAGVNVDLEQSTATGGDATDDILSSIENLTGSAHADTLTGDSAANMIIGFGGSDVMDGGDGNDTVHLANNWEAYTITRSGSTYTITQGMVVVTAANFETFVFNGNAYSVTDDADSIVTAAPPVIGTMLEIGTDEDSDADTFAVTENVASGAEVLRITATDPNTLYFGDVVTFSLVDSMGAAYTGPFAIMADGTGAAKVLTDSAFDFESDASFSFFIRASDLAGNFVDQAVTVAVLDVNEAPGNGAGLATWTPSLQAGLMFGALTPPPVVVDPEGDTLTYELEANPSSGLFYLNGALVTVGTILTAAEFASLTYAAPEAIGDYSNGSFTVSDGVNFVTLDVVITVTAGTEDILSGDEFDNMLDGGAANDNLNSFAGNDVIYGGSGDDVLLNGAGDDAVYGGAGLDTFVTATGADSMYGGTGIDIVKYSKATANTVVSLVNSAMNAGAALGDVLDSVENVTGGSGNDTITGDAQRNTLNGGLGLDRLDGGLGRDVLTGGDGIDTFVFSTSAVGADDVISDFATGVDKIGLSNSVFTAVGITLDAGEFRVLGSGPRDANDFILYNQANGFLYYDEDATGAGASTLIGRLGAGTALVFADLLLV